MVQEKKYVQSEEEREEFKQDDEGSQGKMSQANRGVSCIVVFVTLCKFESFLKF